MPEVIETVGRPTLAERAEEASGVRASGDPRIGQVLDARYRLIRRLGEGGMGLVYEAEHVFLKGRLAVKVLRSDMSDEESIGRLEREAQSASAIGNPHIVDVRDFGRLSDGATYIVMELIDGVDLLTELRRERIHWERAREIGVQIAEALAAAHAQGIVHRDLKPENILLTTRGDEDDFVKIVDFGIARMQGARKITAAGRVVGTPEYMSPEQCAGLEVDARADVYALGILLYEMLTQHLPFHHTDLLELLKLQLKADPEPPREVVPDAEIPEALEQIILRCMRKRPAERYRSMKQVSAALTALDPDAGADEPDEAEAVVVGRRRATQRLPVDARDEAPVAEARGTVAASAPPRRRGLVLALAIIAAVAGALVTGAMLTPPEEETAAVTGVATSDESAPEPAPAPVEETVEEPGPEPAPEASTELTLTSDPSGARVSEGENELGETPFTMTRPSGDERVVLTLSHPGYEPREIELSARSSAELHLALERRHRARSPGGPEEGGAAGGEPARARARIHARAAHRIPQPLESMRLSPNLVR